MDVEDVVSFECGGWGWGWAGRGLAGESRNERREGGVGLAVGYEDEGG